MSNAFESERLISKFILNIFKDTTMKILVQVLPENKVTTRCPCLLFVFLLCNPLTHSPNGEATIKTHTVQARSIHLTFQQPSLKNMPCNYCWHACRQKVAAKKLLEISSTEMQQSIKKL